MTPEVQRIAIAVACGWKFGGTALSPQAWWTPTGGLVRNCPNYPSDLNAMQSAVLAQDEAFQKRFAAELLYRHQDGPKLIHQLSASDWADIFLTIKRE